MNAVLRHGSDIFLFTTMAAEWRAELTFAERIAATSKMHVIDPFHFDNAERSSELHGNIADFHSELLRTSGRIPTVNLQKRRSMLKLLKMAPENMPRPS